MELPLGELGRPAQLSRRVYEVLCESIVKVRLKPGTPLRIDAIASQLRISSTPVRDALNHLEKDGLIVKQPYQSWVVREFNGQEIEDLYELRTGLECFSVRLACRRITEAEIGWLRKHQKKGEEALQQEDVEAYQAYNQELHTAILKASRNSQLLQVMNTLWLQFQMLMAQTIRVPGRPFRAVREHADLVEAIAERNDDKAEKVMEQHLMGALKDILRVRSESQAIRAASKP